jgi:hypothetical protein
MKKVIFAAILMAALYFSGSAFAVLSGGGTEADPYLIQSRADFDEFANPANASLYWTSGKYTKLMCDIDLSDTTYTQAVIAPDISTSVYFQGTQFTGVFDGNNNIISNVVINQPGIDYAGLFGYVGSGGQIRNLGVEKINTTSFNHYGGGLVGYNDSGTLTGCYAIGSVNGKHYVGGLVGYDVDGTITSCYAASFVSQTDTGGGYVGGLVGINYAGTLTSCYATGSVTGDSCVGGLVGYNDSGTLTFCHATGSVTGDVFVGGLVGDTYNGSLTFCYATGSVCGISQYYSYVGGLVGWNANSSGTLTACYATGSVSGAGYVGGLVGSNYGSLIGCYATGSVSGNYYYIGGLVGYNISLVGYDVDGAIIGCYATGSVTGGGFVGGLVGQSVIEEQRCEMFCEGDDCWEECWPEQVEAPWLVENSFWDTQTSGWTNSSGGTGKSTVELQTLSTFTFPPASWDFTNETTNGTDDYWMMLREGEDYPRLAWQTVYPEDIAGLYGINAVDYAEIAAHWGQTGCPTGCEDADINGDGTVDIVDLMSLANNWLEGI